MENLSWIVDNWEFLGSLAFVVGWLVRTILQLRDSDNITETLVENLEDAVNNPLLADHAKVITGNIRTKIKVKPKRKKKLDKIIKKVRSRNGK